MESLSHGVPVLWHRLPTVVSIPDVPEPSLEVAPLCVDPGKAPLPSSPSPATPAPGRMLSVLQGGAEPPSPGPCCVSPGV